MIDRWDLVDGTRLASVGGHRIMVDGMVGAHVRVVDDGGRVPLPHPGWMAIGAYALTQQVNDGHWSIVDGGGDD